MSVLTLLFLHIEQVLCKKKEAPIALASREKLQEILSSQHVADSLRGKMMSEYAVLSKRAEVCDSTLFTRSVFLNLILYYCFPKQSMTADNG